MPGLIIEGREYPVAGLNIRNFHDDKKFCLRMGNDGRARHRTAAGHWHWIRGLFVHITGGPVDKEYLEHQDAHVLPGIGPEGDGDQRILNSWTLSDKSGGAGLILDFDCSIICTCDQLTDAAYAQTSCNENFDALEMLRGSKDGVMYDGQLDAAVRLCDAWTRLMGVQRQYHAPYRAYRPVARLVDGGDDCVGLFGHRDQTAGRGPLDPGDPIYAKLKAAGYEPLDYAQDEDLQVWRDRQRELQRLGLYRGVIDGIAGPGTVAALKAAGHSHGLWVSRPGDDTP
jgi:hypothetical protein